MIQNIISLLGVLMLGIWIGYYLMVRPHISYRMILKDYYWLIEKKETILGRWVTVEQYSRFIYSKSQVENYLNQIKYEEESRT